MDPNAADQTAAGDKRKTPEDGVNQPAEAPASKTARVDEDRVARLPVGANIVEFDGKSCTHEVAWPPGSEPGSLLPPPKRPGPPARQYPFQIDPFQQTSINALEAGHSVLVAAHTSAGKTVVAEYAFAMALRDKARVVYTSPLKALSNQKYRELAEEFVDVGLMTGDVTINPNASCLVMTTEILRSMLYRGSEVVREVQLLVYDEVHYLRDKERGVVWEESIVLAPKAAQFVFLSATLPNAREFAEWVAKVHRSPCHVVYTDYRPTPLQHYVFPAGGDGLFMVVDERGVFRDDNFQKAVAQLTDSAVDAGKKKKEKPAAGQGGKGANGEGEKSDIFKIVRMIMERNYDPVIVFSFSRKECEALSLSMVSMDLTSDDEKELIGQIYWNAMEGLSQEDQRLPQITQLLPMLRRGIGVHHSGLLPIIKEVIEILFQEGLLKALFATETFSTGLNMPAKTVVFTNVRKYDGGGFRWLTSGEYIQMSGRAGRRGLDDKGVVILMLDTKMEPAAAKDMIKGAPDCMYSEFKLGYNMLLNILRVEGAAPEGLMAQSFKQFQIERSLPQLEAKIQRLKAELDAMVVEEEEQVTQYLALLAQLASLRAELRAALQSPQHALPFLQPGRLVRMLPTAFDALRPLPEFGALPALPSAAAAGGSSASISSTEEGAAAGGGSAAVAAACPGVWGTVVNFERLRKEEGGGEEGDGSGKKKHKKDKGRASNYIVDVLVNCEADWNPSGAASSSVSSATGALQAPRLRVLAPKDKGTPHVVTFPLTYVDRLSSVRVYIPKDLRPLEARQQGVKTVGEAVARLCSGPGGAVPLLDPEADLKIDDKGVRKLVSKLEDIERLLSGHPLSALPAEELRLRLAAGQKKAELEEAVQAAKREAKAATGLILKDELKARLRVLRRLGYVDGEGVVTVKGRVAADITSGDELVLCELLFNGAFNGLSPDATAAATSCFVWTEKSDAMPKLSDELLGAFNSIKDAARRVAKVAVESKMQGVDVEDVVSSFRPDLMEPVAMWARGAPFAEVAKTTKIYEGSLVRAVRRLEELLRQLADALSGIGESTLSEQFTAAREKIKRDIIFAASLYL